MIQCSINENLILEDLCNGKIILRNLNTNKIHFLNKTASFILNNLDKDPSELSKLLFKNLSNNKNISIKEIEEDVKFIIEDFKSKGFIKSNNSILNKNFKYVKVKNLYLEIISLCNKKCLYCYNEENISKYEIIEVNNIERLIKQCDPNILEGIILSGGEPFLYENIEEIFILCKKYNLKVAMVSNGSLIDDKKAKMLSKYNINIQFTIDGYNTEINDLTRGEGSFENQIRSLELLQKNKFKGFLNIRVNLWKKNLSYENIKGIVEICERFKISRLDLVEAKKNGSFNEILLESDYKKVKLIIDKINSKINIIYERDVEEFKCELDRDLMNIEFGLRISTNGNVYPCQYFLDNQFAIGNIYFNTLYDIVYGDKNRRLINLISLRKSFIEKCTTCVYGDKCNAGCPAKAYINNGNIFTIDGSCYKRKLDFSNYYIK
ncbi:radical SAM/SPASM domain-containing protein (plasmid) [Clostridium perfringens]|uniref:radical SAM/SPASM domain-containing protein n=1 Tax=Clostridium perfringens TaxID=1502 RepID=UPI0024BC03B6|nr:radical SAM protein [Clostridium perfringens]ELC8332987.1 radical SAM protein [Clostridium perfringens]ELC8464213.1 radical SAM protein [Clostridium perfringens]MDK0553993.1 radical SAM protein [Clostridium perfringens]WVM62169.1 radical SAM protein [Clostridium perfringens]